MPVDVVIIGAGISGLACAMMLSPLSEVNLVVLEAASRIGGRIETILADDGTVLDLGAQFIHGTVENPLYDFALRRGIFENDRKTLPRKSDIVSEVQCFPQDIMSACPVEEVPRNFQIASQYVEDFVRELYKLHDDDVSIYETVGQFMQSMFNAVAAKVQDDHNLLNMLKTVFMNWVFEENICSGCRSVYDLDLRGFKSYIELEGQPFVDMSTRFADGYTTIIKEIVKDLKTDCIHLNCEVNGIDNASIDGISKIKISCGNGKEFYADTAILTVSVGVLKDFVRNNTFLLQLPEKKLAAIEKLHLANIVKIFFKFVTPIPYSINFFTFFQLPQVFDSGPYHCDCRCMERIGSSDWWLVWVVCDDAEFKADDTADYLNNILSSYSSMYTNFPINKVDRNNVITVNWGTNKYVQGLYTYLKFGTDQHDITDLAEPLSYGGANLLFAGEATSKNFFSTTHGAYLSGIREAENVKSKYKI